MSSSAVELIELAFDGDVYVSSVGLVYENNNQQSTQSQ